MKKIKKYKLSFWNRLSLRVYWIPRIVVLCVIGLSAFVALPFVLIWALFDPVSSSEFLDEASFQLDDLIERWSQEVQDDLKRLARKEPTA